MKFSKIYLLASLALSGLCATAQTAGAEVAEYTFQPHWYIQGQAGIQETLGEAEFGRLAAFNAQVAGGYNFTPVFGVRLAVNGWTSRAAMGAAGNEYKWKWAYAAPTVDLTVDLVNLLGGYKPTRVVTGGVFAGVGANIAWNNWRAVAANSAISQATGVTKPLRYLWDGTKTRFLGQFGAFVDFKVASRVKIGVELQANVLNDKYNSKKASNADWYFNGLVGVKYTFGKGYKKTVVAAAQPQVVEKIVEVPVEKIVEKEVVKEVSKDTPAGMARNVFFKIGQIKIESDQKQNIADVAAYLQHYPESKVDLAGYADKGTGSLALNLELAKKRAAAVSESLQKDFGIDASRINVKSMDSDEFQPYASSDPALNRVVICIAQ